MAYFKLTQNDNITAAELQKPKNTSAQITPKKLLLKIIEIFLNGLKGNVFKNFLAFKASTFTLKFAYFYTQSPGLICKNFFKKH